MNTNYLRKYFIMGSQNSLEDPVTVLRKALKAGITAFQFREKGKNSLTGKDKLILGKQLRELCYEYNVPFIINDDVDLAEVLHVDGIHVGQEDEDVAVIRKKHPDKIIGLSVSNLQELTNSSIHLVDYIGAGPVFSTNTKDDTKDAVGLDWIKKLHSFHPDIPIVGIGGINENNSQEVINSGAEGVAVISAITTSKDIHATVSSL